ncbi:MAG: low molecular weight protein arginine phosphatase [Clostridia bacterium]|nr:low molecular weight protein arginine phosphatase [Clostridia bacterium]
MKIMFICTGNICRSAMAHKMLEKRAKEQNKNIEVYSCGVWAQNGDIPTYEGIEIMKNYGIDLRTHRATNIRNSNIENMDVILCATNNHKLNVLSMYPELKDKVFTMKEYCGFSENDLDIKDPWGYGLDVYKKCAKEIEICIEKILEKI